MKQKRNYELAVNLSRATEMWADNLHSFRINLLPAILLSNDRMFVGIEIEWLRWRFLLGIWKIEM